jgi:hypothetical protein
LVAEAFELPDGAAGDLFGLALLEELGAEVGVELSGGEELVDDLEHRVRDRDHGPLMSSPAAEPPVLRGPPNGGSAASRHPGGAWAGPRAQLGDVRLCERADNDRVARRRYRYAEIISIGAVPAVATAARPDFRAHEGSTTSLPAPTSVLRRRNPESMFST